MVKSQEIKIHSPENFQNMRIAGRTAATILDFITDYIKPGITTGELNDLCHNKIIELGAIPAPLNYRGFPKSICTSVNHVVCHGIPGEKKLEEGDIVNIDVTVIMDGWHGDSSRMYYVGNNIPIKATKLCQVTYEAMMLGIEQVKPGNKLNEIGKAIESYATAHGFSVVQDFCGHGIGQVFHMPPNVLHYNHADDTVMQEGMFFTIEPMINAGRKETKILSDGWTAVTRDHSLSAQFEHTIAVTSTGYEIFTLSTKSYTFPPYK
jgi:methionyl aminopeptidase